MSTASRRKIPLRDLLPSAPALSPSERDAWPAPGPSAALYAGVARVGFAVSPVQVFGATYDLDLVLVDRASGWDMHEYARLATPDGPVWMMKDSRAGTLEQTIVASVPGLAHLMPEVPLRRFERPVTVDDRSADGWIDLALQYVNADDVPVEVTWRSRPPKPARRRRNGSTMGHSRDAALVALDVSAQGFARSASLTIGGVRQPMQRILGLVPFQVALVQTQAGFSVGSWRAGRDTDGVWTRHASGALQRWAEVPTDAGVTLVQAHRWRTIRHAFHAHDGALELASMEVVQAGAAAPTCHVSFDPCLPDLRRPRTSPSRSRWVLDVNGQRGHAVGEVVITPQADGSDEVRIVPVAPRWTLDRPIVGTVRTGGDEAGVTLSVVR